MKEIQLMLKPQPNAKPESLATIQVVDPSPVVSRLWGDLPSTIILEDYTRDVWAWKPAINSSLHTLIVKSIDGRNKLDSFHKYLQQRQKSAYGRFASTGLWIVSYTSKFDATDQKLECRATLDMTQIPNCMLKPQKSSAAPANKEVQVATVRPPPSTSASSTSKKGGLLGKLVGAQQRTNQHVAVATQKPRSIQKSTITMNNTTGADNPTINGDGVMDDNTTGTTAAVIAKTAQQVLSGFREKMAEKMLDFDLSSDEELRIDVSLGEYHAGLSNDDKAKVSMEVLKYMVYEAAEEVNEEWIAHREPTGFLDEAVFVVYKEGAAPPEVLEELNKGELPNEVRGQQRALQEERLRQLQMAEMKQKSALESQAHKQLDDEEEALAALNKNKRDRRTIEDYERQKREGAKKSRS